MRKVTEKAVDALMGGYEMRCGNTEVKNKAMYLFGNRIAWYENGQLYIQAVFESFKRISNTTRERLNGLPNVSVYQMNKQVYLNGKPWDGKPTAINL